MDIELGRVLYPVVHQHSAEKKATMGPMLLPILVLVAGCYCAPGNLIDMGTTVSLKNIMEGALGGQLKGNQDGASISATGNGNLEGKIAPEVNAQAYIGVGDKYIAVDGSALVKLGGAVKPGFDGEFGKNSNGTWITAFIPHLSADHILELTPRIQVKTNEDAKKLVGLPLDSESDNQNGATQQFNLNGAPSPYGPVYPYRDNIYVDNSYPNYYASVPYAYNTVAYNNMIPSNNVPYSFEGYDDYV